MTQSRMKTFSNITDRFYYLSVAEQYGLLFGLSLIIALVFGLSLWFKSPDSPQSVIKLDKAVTAENTNDTIKNKETPSGSDALSTEQTFGVSQFIETARYWHALEVDLARTISTFDQVKSARVHLAIPKSTAFLDNDSVPTASVLIELKAGFTFDVMQVEAIKKLVASSVPRLMGDHVTVVDNEGHLLPYAGSIAKTTSVSVADPVASPSELAYSEQEGLLIGLKAALVGCIAFIVLIISRLMLSLLTDSTNKPRQKKNKTAGNVNVDNQQSYVSNSLNNTIQQGQWRRVNKLAAEDPKHIADVIRKWVGDE